jgi:hypothetical protein
MFQT